MEVRDQGADVAGAVGAARVAVLVLEPIHVALHAVGPLEVVRLVHAVDAASVRRANARVREQELAQARLEGEPVDAVSRAVDEHGARAVEHVAGRHLMHAGLQAILEAAGARLRDAPQDREDRADVDVRVDVRRAVERVEVHHVLADRLPLRNGDDVFVLFRRQDRELPGRAQHLVDHVVGEDVELLDLLAVHVLVAREAEDVHQPGARHLAIDHLRRERHVGQHAGELAARPGVQALLLEEELAERDRAGGHDGAF